MLIEEALEYLLDNFVSDLTIPTTYMDGFNDFLDMLCSLNFVIPVDTFFGCVLFTMAFALACGLIRIVVVRR